MASMSDIRESVPDVGSGQGLIEQFMGMLFDDQIFTGPNVRTVRDAAGDVLA